MKVILPVLSVSLLLAGVLILTKRSSKQISSIPEETLYVAEQEGFPYSTLFHKALNGDLEATTLILNFIEKTDAAATLGHRSMIVELGDQVGRQSLIHSISKLKPKFRRHYQWYINGEPAL